MWKKILLWTIALVITLMSAVYQRITGPTHPKIVKFQIEDQAYKAELLRSHAGAKECLLEIPVDDKNITGYIYYKRFKTGDSYSKIDLVHYRDELCGVLPNQPPAGKLQYYIELVDNGKSYFISKDEPVVIRFRGDVPAYILIPHILAIFLSMFFSTLCGIYVISKQTTYKKYVNWAFYTLIIGGLIFGPIVQKLSFGEFWTGVPFGFDLTDNKTLIAFLFWLWAFLACRKGPKPVPVLVASIMTLVIFSIPHSLMGSELDYSTNKVNTGVVLFRGF